MAPTQDKSEFLNDPRLAKIGLVNGRLLHRGGYWIHRRKESVTVIDETAVRRTVSVDFTLPEEYEEGQRFDAVIQHPDLGEPVYCPPLFVLPKASNELMSFDLTNESGASLPLMTRRDNARVSGATLTSLAELVTEKSLSETLVERLTDLATAEAVRPVAAERLMRVDAEDPDFEQLEELRKNATFRWWLWTLAHSSLVGVPYRDPTVRRKIFALSYVESFVSSLRVRTRLGWSPYKVVIDSSWIAARNFHLEAEAPPGLRIAKATLAEDDDDGDKPPLEVAGLLRRVHLSRYEASEAGAGTATLDLRVSGPGFVGGALLACGLVVGAILGCLLHAEAIAKSPTSAPAALLLLPGLIATYVGRSDRHALTTRLLVFARWLLLLAGLAAYGCAAFVALGGENPQTSAELSRRVSHLQFVFSSGAVVAAGCFVGLAIGWLLSKPTARGFLRQVVTFGWVGSAWRMIQGSHFAHSMILPLSMNALIDAVSEEQEALLNLTDRDKQLSTVVPGELAFYRFDLTSTWLLKLHVTEIDGEVELTVHGICQPRLLAWPVMPLLRRREARATGRRLERFGEDLKQEPVERELLIDTPLA